MTDTSRLLYIFPALLIIVAVYLVPILLQIGTSIDPAMVTTREGLDGLFSNSVVWIFASTFRLSIIVTAISCALSFVVAYFIVFWAGRYELPLLILVLISLWLSVLVRAFGLIALFQSTGLVNTFLIQAGLISSPIAFIRNDLGVVIGMVHYMLPITVLPIYATMSALDKNLIRSAHSIGATDGQIFWKIIVPLTKGSVLSSAVLSFVLCLGFYVTPTILGGGRTVMIAEYITVLIQQSLDWSSASIYSILLVATLLCCAALLKLLGKVAAR
jgi:putative spermidine/putrescine transport system permease protein